MNKVRRVCDTVLSAVTDRHHSLGGWKEVAMPFFGLEEAEKLPDRQAGDSVAHESIFMCL